MGAISCVVIGSVLVLFTATEVSSYVASALPVAAAPTTIVSDVSAPASSPENSGPSLSISHSDVSDSVDSTLTLEQVQSEQQLYTFVHAVMHADPRIASVKVRPSSVTMEYAESGTFLASRRVYTTTATISDSGMLTLEKPWYAAIQAEASSPHTPDIGFRDIHITKDEHGITPQSAAQLIVRMHNRFQIGAIK
jgi:hypothetical protein